MKRVMKYMLMLLAVATVGLSVQAWGNGSAQGEATAAAQSVAQAADADIVGLVQDWRCIVMLLIACVLLYLAIVKQYEPLLLLPIAFGMVLTNLPGAGMFHSELFEGGHVHWTGFDSLAGLIDYLYLGVKLGIYPCLIFVGVGAMTDFGPLIWAPRRWDSCPTRLLRPPSSAALTARRQFILLRNWLRTCWVPLPLRLIRTWLWCP